MERFGMGPPYLTPDDILTGLAVQAWLRQESGACLFKKGGC